MASPFLDTDKPPDLSPENHSNSSTVENDAVSDKETKQELLDDESKETLKTVIGLTLGQTLKQELKKSSKKIQDSQKVKTPLSAKIVTYPLPPLDSDGSTEKNKEGAKKSPPENKRKRPRRNPVWQYFDVDEGIAKCLCYTINGKKCEYSTKSVFSTNLKVHLKSHHKPEFAIVLQAEEAMAQAVAAQQTKQQTHEKVVDFRRAERFNTHLSAIDQQKLLELQKRLLHNSTTKSVDNENALLNLLNNNNLTLDESSDISGLLENNKSLAKRKRLRRHPVWNYFKDIDEKTVGCNICEFRTVSAFSTNLKMHLKSRHREQFQRVLQMEGEQRFDDESFLDDLSGSKKKPRLNQTSNNDHSSIDPNFLMLTASEQLAAVVGLLCSNNNNETSNGFENVFNDVEQDGASEKPSFFNGLFGSSKIEASSSSSSEPVEENDGISDLVAQLNSIPETQANKILLSGLKKQVKDMAFVRLIHSVGDVRLFISPAFQEFVASLCPDYTLPSELEIRTMLGLHL